MKRSRTIALTAVAALSVGLTGSAPAAQRGTTSARVWVTTVDRGELLYLAALGNEAASRAPKVDRDAAALVHGER